MATAPRFVVLLTRRYREDDLAWSGIGRLAAELVREPKRYTRQLAILVTQAIEDALPEQRDRLQHYARRLREAK